DGRVGFLLNRVTGVIEVLDLTRFARTGTLEPPIERLQGAFVRGFVPSEDGSELVLLGDVTTVRVLDVATGRVVREIATGWRSDEDAWLVDACADGRSHLLRPEGYGDVPDASLWLDEGGARRGPPSIAVAAVAGSARYGVDAEGRRLYALGRGAGRP